MPPEQPRLVEAIRHLKSERQEHIDDADCAMRHMRDGEGAVMRAASAARARREFRHAMDERWSEASLPMQQVASEAALSLPGNENPPESHGPEPGTEHVEAANDELQANQEHGMSRAAKKRRL